MLTANTFTATRSPLSPRAHAIRLVITLPSSPITFNLDNAKAYQRHIDSSGTRLRDPHSPAIHPQAHITSPPVRRYPALAKGTSGERCDWRLTAAQEFIYTKFSCDDMIPQHTTEVTRLLEEEKAEMESNHVNTPTSPMTEEEEESSDLHLSPKAQMYSGNINMQILTSEDKYRRLKTLEVTLQSSDYINGFLLQARKVEQSKTVVGTFLRSPHRGNIISCNGSMANTVVMETAPLRLANLSFTWLAPEASMGTIEFVASVLVNKSTSYKIIRSDPLKLNLYPVSTRECAVGKSCFRYCMRNGGPECPAHTARYTAILEYLPKTAEKKTSVKITIGGQLADSKGYLAVGFSKDDHRLSEADLSVCYLEGDNATVGVEHYLLKNIDYSPDLHLGELQLESADVDEDYVWCTFTRPITGGGHNQLRLSEPYYYYYFWGARNGTTQSMKRSEKLISTNDNLFNYIMYSSAKSRQAPYSVVAAALLLAGVHFMCW
ncbi:hypothetical protein O3P69_007518 [Scylla paramamosain]|uniref:DOMON domain-containing protein n=1 Tax=Scylla paramamosain TaxID=85552 RepID=A0AAW0V6M8_SCYPA